MVPAVIMLKALREFTRFMRWMQHNGCQPFGPSRSAWAVSLPVDCH